MKKAEARNGRGSTSPVVRILPSVSGKSEERDEDVMAYATAEEFWRRRERNRMMSPHRRHQDSVEEERQKNEVANFDVSSYDDSNAKFFLHFMTSLNRFVDASRDVERRAASASKALMRMRSHRRLHAGSVDDSAHKEVETLLLKIDALKRCRNDVNQLLPRVSSLVVGASESPSNQFQTTTASTTMSANLRSTTTTINDNDDAHGTDLERKLRRVGDGINRLAAASINYTRTGEPACSGHEDSRLSAMSDGSLAAQSRASHDTHDDISRLRSEYLQAVQQIKISHDRHVRLLQKQQKEEVARLGEAHDVDLKREMRAQEDATLRLLKRLGVSGDAISAFVESFADGKRGHSEMDGHVTGGVDMDPQASAFAISQTLAKERQERRELEAKLDTAETDASTARDYALFRQRQKYDMKIGELERDHDEAQARQASEAKASMAAALDPVRKRIRNLRRDVANNRNATDGAADYSTYPPPSPSSSSSSSSSQESAHDESDDNGMTITSSSHARLSKVTDALVRGLSKLEEEVRGRAGVGERGRDANMSGDSVNDAHASKNPVRTKEGQGMGHAEKRDFCASHFGTRRTCTREQEYDELLSELRAMEQRARASEYKSSMRAAARSARRKGTKIASIDDSEAIRKDTAVNKNQYECRDTLDESIAGMLTVSSSSEEGGANCVEEANMTPPQPRRFLPAAVSGDRRRRIRRKEAESEMLHPGIARLLMKSF